MPITKSEFEKGEILKQRSTKQQFIILKFLMENRERAFTTKEISKEVYSDDKKNNIAKTYYVLKRLNEKNLVEHKDNYWKIKEKEVN